MVKTKLSSHVTGLSEDEKKNREKKLAADRKQVQPLGLLPSVTPHILDNIFFFPRSAAVLLSFIETEAGKENFKSHPKILLKSFLFF